MDAARMDDAVRVPAGEFDPDHGGFGGAPRFPPSMVLEFLLRQHERTGHGVVCDRPVTGPEEVAALLRPMGPAVFVLGEHLRQRKCVSM